MTCQGLWSLKKAETRLNSICAYNQNPGGFWFWDFLISTQLAPWITQPPCFFILWYAHTILVTKLEGDKMKPKDCFISFPLMCQSDSSLYKQERKPVSYKALRKPLVLTWESLENYILLAEPSTFSQRVINTSVELVSTPTELESPHQLLLLKWLGQLRNVIQNS